MPCKNVWTGIYGIKTIFVNVTKLILYSAVVGVVHQQRTVATITLCAISSGQIVQIYLVRRAAKDGALRVKNTRNGGASNS